MNAYLKPQEHSPLQHRKSQSEYTRLCTSEHKTNIPNRPGKNSVAIRQSPLISWSSVAQIRVLENLNTKENLK